MNIDLDKLNELFKSIIDITNKESIGSFVCILSLILILFSGWRTTKLSYTDDTSPSRGEVILAYLPGVVGLIFSVFGVCIVWSLSQSSLEKENKILAGEVNTFKSRQIKGALDGRDILKRLEINQDVQWLIRIIAYYPETEPERSLERLSSANLGLPNQRYTFVSDYEELRGLTAKDAVKKTGLPYKDGQRVSAIIFPLIGERIIFPANARGLIQVIDRTESTIQPTDKPESIIESGSLFQAKNRLGEELYESLSNVRRTSWAFSSYRPHYRQLCEQAFVFVCHKVKFSAASLMGNVTHDWHPLGFARISSEDADPCDEKSGMKNNYCSIEKWPGEGDFPKDFVGARVFLTENSKVSSLAGRIMIDFNEPKYQRIPSIYLERANNETAGE